MSLAEFDIREQLPEHLMRDPYTAAVAAPMAEAAAELRAAVVDMANQFSPVTATWALPEWERLVGITPDAGAALDDRRAAVAAKLCSSGTTTKEMIRALAESLTGYGAVVTEDASAYEFSLSFVGPTAGFISVDADLIREAVELIKPAHLRFVIQPILWGDLTRAGLTWAELEAQFSTWSDIESAVCCRKEE